MKFNKSSKNIILFILLIVSITLILNSIISILLSKTTNLNIPTIGAIKTIGVEAYWDENLENITNIINWNNLWLGSSKNVTLYMRSISNEKTVLKLNATNWNPRNISKYMNITWNYYQTPVTPDEVVIVTITLSAPGSESFIEYLITNNVQKFTFELIISTTTE